MIKIRVKHEKIWFAVLIVLLLLCVLAYSYLFYVSYAREEFVRSSIRIAEENQQSVFRLNKVLLFHSAGVNDYSHNHSLQNLGICQYSDISISIDNTSYIYDLTPENTVKELFIDNIQMSSNGSFGEMYLAYKNLNDFGKYLPLTVPENGRIDFQIVNTNEQNEAIDYSKPTFYTDCSNPISLGFVNKDIIPSYSVSEENSSIALNGKLLGQANIDLQAISYVLQFDIHIKNHRNETFIYHAKLDVDLTGDNNAIVNGSYYQARNNLVGSEYDFFKEVK